MFDPEKTEEARLQILGFSDRDLEDLFAGDDATKADKEDKEDEED